VLSFGAALQKTLALGHQAWHTSFTGCGADAPEFVISQPPPLSLCHGLTLRRLSCHAKTGRIIHNMRSPKQRSRSKQNRPRTLGNIINRVFDSSGPEGKVRGTPQQIIEKYQVLARDAQLSNDRVAAENFQQHAEHYTRLLAQATREMQAEADARRIAHEEQQAQQARQRQQHDDRQPRQNGHNGQNQPAHRRPEGDDAADQRAGSETFGLVPSDAEDTTLVDTPEARVQNPEPVEDRSAPAPKPEQRDSRADARPEGRKDPRPPRDDQQRRAPRPDRPRRDAPRTEPGVSDAPVSNTAPVPDPVPVPDPAPDASVSADTPAAKPRRNVRKPRKPAGDAPQGQEFTEPADPSRAAE
jgi:hypothetical protein